MSRLNKKNGHSLGYLFVLKYISTSKEITSLKPVQWKCFNKLPCLDLLVLVTICIPRYNIDLNAFWWWLCVRSLRSLTEKRTNTIMEYCSMHSFNMLHDKHTLFYIKGERTKVYTKSQSNILAFNNNWIEVRWSMMAVLNSHYWVFSEVIYYLTIHIIYIQIHVCKGVYV